MTHHDRYVSVAVAGPLRKTFIYRVPPQIEQLQPGQRVVVPFGSARKIGFYLGPAQRETHIQIKDVIRAIDEHTLFPSDLFEFCCWMSDYYFANPADCLAAALPPIVKSAKKPRLVWGRLPLDEISDEVPTWLLSFIKPGKTIPKPVIEKIKRGGKDLLPLLIRHELIVEQWPDIGTSKREMVAGYRTKDTERWFDYFSQKRFHPELFDGTKKRIELKQAGWSDRLIRKAVSDGILEPVYQEGLSAILDFVHPREDVSRIELNDEQRIALEKVKEALKKGFSSFLLHGVTGSGKTIVYCHISREVLNKGRTVLVLTPEIALTGTTLEYFRGYFGNIVTVIHSSMTERERLASWQGIRQGKYKIVVGPRSAVFAPLPDLGLVIVDEEHDGSYKQNDPSPRFHGRDAAIMRAKINNIPVLLGSASPSIESYYHATTGRYRLLRLTKRPGLATLPIVQLVDMSKERVKGDLPFVSYPLKKKVDTRLTRDEQVILYLNRRGHSPILKCRVCGHVTRCPNCRVNLTYHKIGHKLSCHYCGFVVVSYDRCAGCGGAEFVYLGAGTQKVEESIPRLFEGTKAVRFDSDSASGRKKGYQILSEFAQRKFNLLLGTQMVTKGLDLPGVTLVGVLSADFMLDFPDFRASERTFAQLLQVAGRSGRADKPGDVLIQTYYPESDVITDAARQDYQSFYDHEIHSRQAHDYPPFSHLVNFVLSSKNEKKLESSTLSFRDRLFQKLKQAKVTANLLGPAPCPMYYLRGRYRRHLFIKTRQVVKLVRLLTDWESHESRFKLPSTIKIVVDVDPDDMM
ncbi:MAG: primosomal protein N' [Candidatus Zixiibacteriota bacterium]